MTAETYTARVAEQSRASMGLPLAYSRLVDHAVAAALPPDQLALAACGDPDAISSIGRAIAVHEGYLIEASIAEAAKSHSGHLILTGVKLPVLQEAVNLIVRHQPDQVCALSVDAEGRALQSYFPDLVIVNRAAHTGIVLDIKRSLAGYGGSGKLNELQTKMAAAALALPDVLWRDHKRSFVDRVGCAIIDASRTEDDVAGGLWGLSGLDNLLGCNGVGETAKAAVAAFRQTVRQTWVAAMTMPTTPASADKLTQLQAGTTEGCRHPRNEEPRPAQVTLFRPGTYPVH